MRAKPRVAHVLVERGGVAQAVEDKVERAATVSGVSASRTPSIAAAPPQRQCPSTNGAGANGTIPPATRGRRGGRRTSRGRAREREVGGRRVQQAVRAGSERGAEVPAGSNTATICMSASPSSASTATSGPTSKPCASAPWCARRDGDRPRRDERRRPGIGRRAAVDRKDDGGVRDRERDELPPRGERDGRDDRPLDADAGGALPRGKDKRVAARAKPQDAVGVCPRAGREADGEGSAAASKTHLRRRG